MSPALSSGAAGGCDGPTRDEREYSGTVMGTAAAVKRSLGLLAEAVNG